MARQNNSLMIIALVGIAACVCLATLGIGLYFWAHTNSTPALEPYAVASLLSASETKSACPAFNAWVQTTLPSLLQNSMTMTAAEYNQQLLSDMSAVVKACPSGTYYNSSDPQVALPISKLYSLAATSIPGLNGTRRFYPLMGFKLTDTTSTCPAFNTWLASQPFKSSFTQRLASFNATNLARTCPLTTTITDPLGNTQTLGAFQQSLVSAAATEAAGRPR